MSRSATDPWVAAAGLAAPSATPATGEGAGDPRLALLEQLLDTLADGVLAIDRTGQLIYWSPRAERLSGLAAKQVIGRPAPAVLGHLADQLRRKREGTLRGLADFPAGRIPLRIEIVRAQGLGGVALGQVAALTDLRREWQARAEREQREALATVGRTAATVAHQLRNPLGAALGFLELATHEVPPGADASLLEQVRVGLQEIDRRIGELLRYVRIRPPQPVPTDLVPIVRAVCTAVAARFPETAAMELELPRTLMLAGDPEQLQQVIENLVVNAVEEAGAAGRVSVLLQAPGVGGLPRTRDQVRLLVRNTGGQLGPGELTRIFEPFVSSKRGGTGLGLPLARSLVRAHGGSLEAVSAGEWTTFVVTLPKQPVEPAEEAAA